MADKYLGIGKSRLYFDCENEASVGQVLVVDSSGKLVTAFLRQENIADGAIAGRHTAAFDQLIFGYPDDGNFVADGTTAMPGATLASMTYTLTRDVNFGRLTVNTGVTIAASGYRLFANTLQLNGTAVIHNDGGDGAAASGLNPGAGGAAAGAGSISYSCDPGRAGGKGWFAKQGDNAAGGARAIEPALGGAGGLGGDGTDGNYATPPHHLHGAQGAGGSVTAPKTSVLRYPKILDLTDTFWGRGVSGGSGGSGGGAGGSGTATGGGGGGGGGAGGGVCLVVAGVLDTQSGSWTGRISANGGNGGDGTQTAGGGGDNPGDGGVGAGGGGGAAILLTRIILGNLTPTTTAGSSPSACLSARGGAGGGANPLGSTANSTQAAPGRAILINLSQPYVQPNELGRLAFLEARPTYAPRQPFRGRMESFPHDTMSLAPPPILSARPAFRPRSLSGSRDVLKP